MMSQIRRLSLSKRSDELTLQQNGGHKFRVTNVQDNPGFQEDEEKYTPDPMEVTSYVRTLQRLTREALPNMEHYRDARSVHGMMPRPTLDDLHNETVPKGSSEKGPDPEDTSNNYAPVKFGWITGVYVRCMLNIWGPIMFLRLTYVVGQCGIGLSIVIILISCVITVITGLSISAISTNGVVKGGGTYYLISRSLGPEYGGSIGLIFAFANAVAVAMHTVGFSESLKDLLKSEGVKIVDGDINDMRIIGLATVCLLVTVVIVGMEWEQKAQVVLLVVLLAAIFDVVIGSFLNPDDSKKARGFEGWNGNIFKENFGPDFQGKAGFSAFFSSFSIYFPATTGILAGANISGDLKDPSVAIPKGTLLAIATTSGVYLLFAIIAGACVWRYADGDVAHYLNGTYQDCSWNNSCTYGLQNHYQVMELLSGFGYLIYAGCFAATLSSALACLVSAPKIFQALCVDKIIPPLFWFGKGYGKNNEPIRSYILAFIIAACFIAIAKLDTITPIISNFFMAAYCLINFACFHAALASSPGFRPGFKYWNKWVSLFGALISAVVMFIMDWKTALATFAIMFALYMYLSYKAPDVNWGSSRQAVTYKSALQSAQELVLVEDHVKNYRPGILLMTGEPRHRPALCDFAYSLTKGIGLLVCGHVVEERMLYNELRSLNKSTYDWFKAKDMKAFYSVMVGESLDKGTESLLQAVGVGKLRPNILMMGYMGSWQTTNQDAVLSYVDSIHTAFDNHVSVALLRLKEGMDYSEFLEEEEAPPLALSALFNGTANRNSFGTEIEVDSNAGTPTEEGPKMITDSPKTKKEKKEEKKERKEEKKGEKEKEKKKRVGQNFRSDAPRHVMKNVELFRSKQKKGTIDVWWLYDDGGLTMLLPYLLTTRKNWEKCKLRVFTLCNKDSELDEQQLNLASLLAKFRIDCSEVTVLPDVTKKPEEHSMREYDLMIARFKEKSGNMSSTLTISDNDLTISKHKTLRYIRIRELLQEHSRGANLVVVTLPMPRKNRIPPALYLSWLELLTKSMPPVMLVRGDQSSVLTFYS